MPFINLNDMDPEVLPGTNRKVLQGDNLTMLFLDREANVVQDHSHPQEQVIYLVEGQLKVRLEGEEDREIEAGNAVRIPGGLPHRIETLTPVRIISIYSPARNLSSLSSP